MLTFLRIRDLALIEDVQIEPGEGLTALTGETGAGKSILLDGLALLAGARASTDDVRSGAEEIVIEGLFVAPSREEGADEPEERLLRRTVKSTGSRAWVDDRLVTVGALRDVGERLVEIAGQHESQVLLSPASHLDLLDRYGELAAERERVAAAWEAALEIRDRLRALQTDDRERSQREDFLRFQVREIEAAGLEPGEDAELASERQRLRNAEQLRESVAAALEALYESEDSAVAQLDRAGRAVDEIARLDEGSGLERAALDEARFTVDDAARGLQAYADGLEADPGRLEEVEQRLAAIDTLRRKYGDTVEEILEQGRKARAELESLENRDEEIKALSVQLGERVEEFDRVASRLGEHRRATAERLEEQITAELHQLGMEGARFRVRVTGGKGEGADGLPPGAGRKGYEEVDFELAANPGEPPRPLAKVASGGELSRVLLALKLAEVHGASPLTIVFDEVDAGVGGGRVAERLAERLADLARTHQVLVVTHLPQIAARAGSHLRVRKGESTGRTVVSVEELDNSERVDELARMLGGVDPTEDLRRHARHLLAAGD